MSDESKPSKKDIRRRQILGATLRLLRRHGTAITTAQIAAEANCSKETLYNWFDDRDGIMLALVEEQATSMGDVLRSGFSSVKGSPEEKLVGASAFLLDVMTGDAVIAVNRVAMAQACSEVSSFGDGVLANWNGQVVGVFEQLFADGHANGSWKVENPNDAFECLAGLLVGDRQRRILLGEKARPDGAQMMQIAELAVNRWLMVHST